MSTPPWLAALAAGVAGRFTPSAAPPTAAPPPVPTPSVPPPAATGIPPNVMLIGGVAAAALVVFLLVR